jgi:hypothetical protein
VNAELRHLQHLLADIFTALYPPPGVAGTGQAVEVADLPRHVAEMRAERDRLRAVVRRAQEAWALHVADDPDEYDGTSPALIEWMAAWEALRALDVSPVEEAT